MSKLRKAQSKTGKTGIVEKVIETVIERKIDDKAEEYRLRVDWGEAPPKKRRKNTKRSNHLTKKRKRPDRDSGS